MAEPMAGRHLAAAVARFYVDVEESDPYSKDSKRAQATAILQALWEFPGHRDALVRLTRCAGAVLVLSCYVGGIFWSGHVGAWCYMVL